MVVWDIQIYPALNHINETQVVWIMFLEIRKQGKEIAVGESDTMVSHFPLRYSSSARISSSGVIFASSSLV